MSCLAIFVFGLGEGPAVVAKDIAQLGIALEAAAATDRHRPARGGPGGVLSTGGAAVAADAVTACG